MRLSLKVGILHQGRRIRRSPATIGHDCQNCHNSHNYHNCHYCHNFHNYHNCHKTVIIVISCHINFKNGMTCCHINKEWGLLPDTGNRHINQKLESKWLLLGIPPKYYLLKIPRHTYIKFYIKCLFFLRGQLLRPGEMCAVRK